MTILDPKQSYQIILARDVRFDGKLFVGVTTTGIYCRPVCPAVKPRREHCQFYSSASAAQMAGFRPCLRCRPESSPNIGIWRGTSNTVSRALKMIEEGGLDGKAASVDALASRLGVGERHLRRLFKEHVGAPPVVVAQTRRILFAKKLLHETTLSMSEVALASGFESLRRFNDCFHLLFNKPPSQLRKQAIDMTDDERANGTTKNAILSLNLSYAPPYNWEEMLKFLHIRAIEGIEYVDKNHYRRTFCINGAQGMVDVSHKPDRHSLQIHIETTSTAILPSLVARIRCVFDLDADIMTIEDHLSRDPFFEPLIAGKKGLRLPGAWDSFEMGVRAILGQQVTLGAARNLAGQLVVLCGSQTGFGVPLNRGFPKPADILAADLTPLKMPGARKRALQEWCRAVIEDSHFFDTSASLEDVLTRLIAIRGIGEWTAHYIALRVFRETDAFPASDVGLLRTVEKWTGVRSTVDELKTMSLKWAPWRAYAAQHIWAHDIGSIGKQTND